MKSSVKNRYLAIPFMLWGFFILFMNVRSMLIDPAPFWPLYFLLFKLLIFISGVSSLVCGFAIVKNHLSTFRNSLIILIISMESLACQFLFSYTWRLVVRYDTLMLVIFCNLLIVLLVIAGKNIEKSELIDK